MLLNDPAVLSCIILAALALVVWRAVRTAPKPEPVLTTEEPEPPARTGHDSDPDGIVQLPTAGEIIRMEWLRQLAQAAYLRRYADIQSVPVSIIVFRAHFPWVWDTWTTVHRDVLARIPVRIFYFNTLSDVTSGEEGFELHTDGHRIARYVCNRVGQR